MEEIMTEFKSLRVAHEYTQTNSAPPEKVFPLLCPVREADWAPGWHYNLVYSDSGAAELGCIFTTPGSPADTTWIVTEYDPSAFRIAFVWVEPERVAAEIRIHLTPAENGVTRARIFYRYTGLSPEGNREIESYSEQWFQNKMHDWEAAINHYLHTGKIIGASK
jgi:hypothetical protein